MIYGKDINQNENKNTGISINKSIYLYSTNYNEIETIIEIIIAKLSNSKSKLDGRINNVIIKKFRFNIIEYFIKLINIIYSNDIYPKILTESKIPNYKTKGKINEKK